MAIIIPSKNIYDKQNPKILKNVIKKIEYGAKTISPLIEKQVQVLEKSFFEQFENGEVGVGENTSLAIANGVEVGRAGFLKIIPIYLKSKVEIDLINYNRLIERFYLGKDENEQPYIQVKINAHETVYFIEVLQKNAFNEKTNEWNFQGLDELEYLQKTLQSETEINNVSKIELNPSQQSMFPNLVVNSNLVDLTNILREDIVQIEKDKAVFDIVILCGYYRKFLQSEHSHNQNSNSVVDAPFIGTESYVIPQKVSLNILGDVVGISLENDNFKIGEENSKKTIKFDSNELIQTTNYYDDTVNEVENSLIKNYNTTLAEYQNGKETAEILCSISNYYDESGKGKISTEEATLPMTFNIGDEVVPMVMNSLGKDVPMSKSKTFEVVGVDFIYDGAVWQKLTLLQK